jgi:two-component system LytT family response regulator
MIKALIVDDEPLAREGIRARLIGEPDIEVVGEAADGFEAVAAIASLAPDLLFLDVHMPGLDGFEVLRRLPTPVPAVVLVTAYDSYAVRAFEAQALDYLLKPINGARFGEVLGRVRRTLLPVADSRGPRAHSPAAHLARFPVKDRDRFLLLKPEQVDWIHSAGNYAELHARGRSFLVRMTMSDLEEKLDPARFVRIHRSTIVNLDRVSEIRPELHGEFEVVIEGGTKLRLSRRYRDRLLP